MSSQSSKISWQATAAARASAASRTAGRRERSLSILAERALTLEKGAPAGPSMRQGRQRPMQQLSLQLSRAPHFRTFSRVGRLDVTVPFVLQSQCKTYPRYYTPVGGSSSRHHHRGPWQTRDRGDQMEDTLVAYDHEARNTSATSRDCRKKIRRRLPRTRVLRLLLPALPALAPRRVSTAAMHAHPAASVPAPADALADEDVAALAAALAAARVTARPGVRSERAARFKPARLRDHRRRRPSGSAFGLARRFAFAAQDRDEAVAWRTGADRNHRCAEVVAKCRKGTERRLAEKVIL